MNLNGLCKSSDVESGFVDDIVLPTESVEMLNDIKTLTLRSNGLQNFPVSVLQLASLTTLDLSNNQLLTLPPEISALKK